MDPTLVELNGTTTLESHGWASSIFMITSTAAAIDRGYFDWYTYCEGNNFGVLSIDEFAFDT
jgi:hypothetical protein